MPRLSSKHTASLEERLGQMAQECRDKAKTLPPGIEREQMLRKARQAETASHVSEWVAFAWQDRRLGSRQAGERLDPTFPIIYMTGAAAAEWPSKGVPNSILLNKPFALAQLVTAVSQLLNAGSPIAPAD